MSDQFLNALLNYAPFGLSMFYFSSREIAASGSLMALNLFSLSMVRLPLSSYFLAEHKFRSQTRPEIFKYSLILSVILGCVTSFLAMILRNVYMISPLIVGITIFFAIIIESNRIHLISMKKIGQAFIVDIVQAVIILFGFLGLNNSSSLSLDNLYSLVGISNLVAGVLSLTLILQDIGPGIISIKAFFSRNLFSNEISAFLQFAVPAVLGPLFILHGKTENLVLYQSLSLWFIPIGFYCNYRLVLIMTKAHDQRKISPFPPMEIWTLYMTSIFLAVGFILTQSFPMSSFQIVAIIVIQNIIAVSRLRATFIATVDSRHRQNLTIRFYGSTISLLLIYIASRINNIVSLPLAMLIAEIFTLLIGTRILRNDRGK